MSKCCTALALAIALMASVASADDLPFDEMPNFRLTDHTGTSHELYHYGDAEAVVIYLHGNGCPIVRQSVPYLKNLRETYAERGVVFLMLNANAQDDRDEIAEEAAEFEIDLPILQDPAQMTAYTMGVKRTATVLVADPKEDFELLYFGAMDDRFDYGSNVEPKNHYLRDALDAHLAGEPVATARTEVKGCLISYMHEDQAAIRYEEDVVPVLANRCMPCHVDGSIGPFSLESYADVRGWSAMIQETIMTRRMPPWHADPHYSAFESGLGMTSEEERTLLAWIEDGARREDRSAPDPLVAHAERLRARVGERAWTLGEPDVTMQLPEPQVLPATGVFDYEYVEVDPGLTEDAWLRAVEVKPTNLQVVHHALVFMRYPKSHRHLRYDPRGGLSGYFAAYLPGAPPPAYPEGTGQFVPAGATFVFQMHYNATGREEVDQTEMGLYFYDEPPAKELRIRAASNRWFEIPPNSNDYTLRTRYPFPQDVTLLAMSPHMHYRGSHMRFALDRPGPHPAHTLLSVPFYQFDWQPLYTLAQPIEVPAGSILQVQGGFDNTRFNPDNPDPDVTVGFGEQSHDEMFIGYLAYSIPRDPGLFEPQRPKGEMLARFREVLPGTIWRLHAYSDLHFNADGTVDVRPGTHTGRWEMDGDTVTVSGSDYALDFAVRDMGLYQGERRLMRLDAMLEQTMRDQTVQTAAAD